MEKGGRYINVYIADQGAAEVNSRFFMNTLQRVGAGLGNPSGKQKRLNALSSPAAPVRPGIWWEL